MRGANPGEMVREHGTTGDGATEGRGLLGRGQGPWRQVQKGSCEFRPRVCSVHCMWGGRWGGSGCTRELWACGWCYSLGARRQGTETVDRASQVQGSGEEEEPEGSPRSRGPGQGSSEAKGQRFRVGQVTSGVTP